MNRTQKDEEVQIKDLQSELFEARRLYDSTCQEKHRLARLLDQCRIALKAVKNSEPNSDKLVADRLERCEDYIRCRPEREWSSAADSELT